MEKWIRWIFAFGGIVLLVFLLVWGTSKLMGASRAEREALTLMSVPANFTGKNAYPAIWLLDYPIPANERDAVMAEDVRRLAETPPPDTDGNVADYVTVAGSRYTSDRPADDVRKRFCVAREDCLAKVRADLPGYEKLMDQHAAWMGRAVQATHADHLSNPFTPRMDMPFPSFVSTYAPATLFAVQFTRGDKAPALSSTCRAYMDWRKLGAHSDLFVGWGVARGYGAEGLGKLLAQILAETPNDQPLPSDCAKALTLPAAAEMSMCPAVRGEFNFMMSALDSMMEAELRKRGMRYKLLLDEDMTRAMMAVPMAKYCSDAADAAFAADKSLLPAKEMGMVRLQCASNAIGCVLVRIAGPRFQSFELSHRDGLAMKRALAGLAWWRSQPNAANDPVATLQRLPAQYRSTAHPLRLSTDKKALVMPALYQNRKDTVLPLPGSAARQATD